MNCHFDEIDELFTGNPVWDVYGDLFRISAREIDFSILADQGFDVPKGTVTTKQGSFMGDALSFAHLTMMLSTIVSISSTKREQDLHKVKIERPFGQSVGDDIILFNAKPWQCRKFTQTCIELGLELSKIDATAKSGVFAEQYVYTVVDQRDKARIPTESLFGDLWFVDSIKMMLLTGKPKVSSEKRNSFIGQATALNKQLQYLPPEDDWKRLRCRVYLWVNNYDDCRRLGRAKPHFPPELGGLDVPVGGCERPDNPVIKDKYLPYFYSMLEMKHDKFIAYYLLLKGIFSSAPKGVPWSNNPDRLMAVCSTAAILHTEDVEKEINVGDFYYRLGQGDRLRYLNHKHNYVSASQIDTELSRRETYLEMWKDPDGKFEYRTLKTKNSLERHERAWAFIRQNVPKGQPRDHHRGKDLYRILATEFRMRLWGFFINREDPAIKGIFEGASSMYVDFDELLL